MRILFTLLALWHVINSIRKILQIQEDMPHFYHIMLATFKVSSDILEDLWVINQSQKKLLHVNNHILCMKARGDQVSGCLFCYPEAFQKCKHKSKNSQKQLVPGFYKSQYCFQQCGLSGWDGARHFCQRKIKEDLARNYKRRNIYTLGL